MSETNNGFQRTTSRRRTRSAAWLAFEAAMEADRAAWDAAKDASKARAAAWDAWVAFRDASPHRTNFNDGIWAKAKLPLGDSI